MIRARPGIVWYPRRVPSPVRPGRRDRMLDVADRVVELRDGRLASEAGSAG